MFRSWSFLIELIYINCYIHATISNSKGHIARKKVTHLLVVLIGDM